MGAGSQEAAPHLRLQLKGCWVVPVRGGMATCEAQQDLSCSSFVLRDTDMKKEVQLAPSSHICKRSKR